MKASNLLLIFFCSLTISAQTADEVLDKAAKAIGERPALESLKSMAGAYLDPELVEAFILEIRENGLA